ncbi:hypothetical protein F8M41_001721 [Gigaspora margarita]|uniref:Uncharacterized protein n=1 Tax=Gigaspora margarita TaxID=4874 RepID=A0A8H4AYZ2_GIGMA|nr:hypothetical protein F8M41_001721 [Gigaspora margarita]
MWMIFESLKGTSGFAEFLPQEFCDSDFQYYMKNIENYINPAGIHFNTAQMLIQCLSQEYTLRSSLISLQKPDVNIFISHQIQASTATQLSFGPVVDQKINEDYSKIFSMHEKYESKNANFALLLQSQNDDPMKGTLISKFKQYWELSIREEENSTDQQSAKSLIAEIMYSLENLYSKTSETFKLAKVSPLMISHGQSIQCSLRIHIVI